MKPLSIVILAAGLGSRMKSELPKPLHKIGGKPMLDHVLESARKLNPAKLIVVYGHRGEVLKDTFLHQDDITWAEQKTFKGTGDAMKYALPYCEKDSNVLVLYGDTPLINYKTLEQLVETTRNSSKLTWLTSLLDNPTGYGRIIRDANREMIAIIEEKDADETEKMITEINTGIFITSLDFLQQALPKISNENQQKEYYLTDIASLAINESITIQTIEEDPALILGVNDRIQLAHLERYYQKTRAEELMRNGVTLDKPETLTIKGSIKNGFDCHIEANVSLEGNIILGSNVTIRMGSILKNVVVDDNTIIHPYSVIEDAKIGKQVSIGPFARIREKTDLRDNSRVGNFVETKNTTLGEGSKANHLSYIGDSVVGKEVNIGAGVITCNYDGANKHKTTINDRAFIGSNSSLVAPVIIDEEATIGAGSTITNNINKKELAFTRAPLKRVSEWERPTKKKKK